MHAPERGGHDGGRRPSIRLRLDDRSAARLDATGEVEYRYKRDGQIALVLGWQGADPIALNGTLRVYFELGLRSWDRIQHDQRYGSGCLEPSRGLTSDGESLVDQAHALNMLLDVGAIPESRHRSMSSLVLADDP